MPTCSGSGTVVTDISGSSCSANYNMRLVRDRSGLPDSVEFEADGIPNCYGQSVFPTRSWSSGNFHFDFRVISRELYTSGNGEARW